MDLFLSILAFILIFSLVVLIHEFGHFAMARRAGIKVEEFGIGLPPRVYGYKRKGIIWSINLIPFGGFVKMLGEDMGDPKALKSKDSFINKTLGQRIKVVIAGVFMNILLAFVLLTIGFTIGIEPLIVDENDFFQQLKIGNIHIETGLFVKRIAENSNAEVQDIRSGDQIIFALGFLNSKNVILEQLPLYLEKDIPLTGKLSLKISRNGKILNKDISLNNSHLGISIYPLLDLPHLTVSEVKSDSSSAISGLRSGDVILEINSKPIFSVEEYRLALDNSSEKLDFLIYRNNKKIRITVPIAENSRTLIVRVFPDSPAERAGFKEGDRIVRIDSDAVNLPKDVRNKTQKSAGQNVQYEILRDDSFQTFSVTVPKDGYLGVLLSQVLSYQDQELSLYESSVMSSIFDIKEIKYPFYLAPFKVFSEIKRLSYMTAEMFTQVLGKIIGEGKVPHGVAGPVGIARMTYTFVQEGFKSLLRFTALISLSLGVINILPLPALDGGRLAFLVMEGLVGHRLKPSWEARIHFIGFVLLIILILFVTWNDVSQLLASSF